MAVRRRAPEPTPPGLDHTEARQLLAAIDSAGRDDDADGLSGVVHDLLLEHAEYPDESAVLSAVLAPLVQVRHLAHAGKLTAARAVAEAIPTIT
jgi:hypothetical protein